MEKVFIVKWTNGEVWREDEIIDTKGVFSTMEKAQSYVDKWESDYRKEGEEFFTHRGEEFNEEDFKDYFTETMWISTWDVQ
jgi:hypothetical protein